jgi:hypothetical protein
MQIESYIREGYFFAILQHATEVPIVSPDGERYLGLRKLPYYNGYLCVPPTHPLAECEGYTGSRVPLDISNAVIDGITYAEFSGSEESAIVTPMRMFCIGFSTCFLATKAESSERTLRELFYKLSGGSVEDACYKYRISTAELLAATRERVVELLRERGDDLDADELASDAPTPALVRRELRHLSEAVTAHYRDR